MNFTNVSVFDAATMTEVGGEDESGNTAGTGKDVAELPVRQKKIQQEMCAVSWN